MITFKSLAFSILFVTGLAACGNQASPPEESAAQATDTAQTGAAAPAGEEQVLTLHAQFVEFTLGDAEHFTFKDESGKMWDFGGCEAQEVMFAEELPEAQANETNQGWTSNKNLQNKWFDLKYVIRQQPQYIDGPVGDVPVIIGATMAEH